MLLCRIALIGLLMAPVVAGATDLVGVECRFVSAEGAPVELQKVRLAGATRDAFTAGVGSAVIGSCAGEPGVLIASVGAAGLAESESVTLRIEAEYEDGWILLREESVSADSDGWVDLRLPLESAVEGRRRFRFASTVRDASTAQAHWGAVRFLPARSEVDKPLNLVLISLDTLGAGYLASFGGLTESSENIDAFLKRSFSFRRAYATYPNTLVSHASLFSGLYPTSHGVYGGIRDSQVGMDMLPTVFRDRGYLNVAYTENAFVSSDFGFDRDFDWYDDGPERGESSFLGDARETFGRARTWLERYGADAPFLLFVHTYEVHSPYVTRDAQSRQIADRVFAGAEVVSDAASSADTERLHNAGFARLSPDQVRRLEALHYGEISYLDRQFAELIRAIESMPFADRTLVVVFSDHGDEFDPYGKIGHGETLADVVMHVPLAFYLPGRIAPGVYEEPVSLVDVAPTVLELLGVPGTLSVDGRSLVPLLTADADADAGTGALEPRAVFAELQRAAGTCEELRLPHDCFVGRFVAYSGAQRFETSMIPLYETLSELDGEKVYDPDRTAVFHGLLSGYVTGSPWSTRVPWRPSAVKVDRSKRPAIDDVTRQRLEALGYDF